MTAEPAQIVLVTGASRGIGADIAHQLAAPDTHVIVNYRENAGCANAVADAIRLAGGHASTLRADISAEFSATAMIDAIADRFGRLDAVVLNASVICGDAGSAARLNRNAQRRLALLAMPLMPARARIVYVTNDQAHFYPQKAVPKGCTALAVGKRAGETALYAMRSQFDRADIHLTVVSGDMADASTAAATVAAVTGPQPTRLVHVRSCEYLMTA